MCTLKIPFAVRNGAITSRAIECRPVLENVKILHDLITWKLSCCVIGRSLPVYCSNKKGLGLDFIFFFIFSGENTKYFSICLHHGGTLLGKMRNFVYEHGKVDYIDYVDPDFFLTMP